MTILALDYGTKRIGLAISDDNQIIAAPLETYHCRGRQADLDYLAQLIADRSVQTIVVGLPLNMDGSEGPSAVAARALADQIGEASGVPVAMMDERLSSVSAEDAMIEAGLSRQKRKEKIDKLAAQIILQSFLDSRAQPDS